MDKRLTELEIKFSYQEQLIDELRTVVTDQEHKIDFLLKRLKDYEESQRLSEGNLFKDSIDEEPPPHY